MKLNELTHNDGAKKRKMRVGRGIGSGKGKTCGRGVKGQKARTGVSIGGFEGGQMPLHMRMPKRGFNNPDRLEFAEVNLWRIEQAIAAGKLDAGQPIDAQALLKAGLVRRLKDGVKLLGTGKLTSKIDLKLTKATKSAQAAVEKVGGKIEFITREIKPVVRKKPK